MRKLNNLELSTVFGGQDDIIVVSEPNNFLVEQFRLFRMGQPSLFGPNPDTQLMDPPPALPG